MAACSLQDFPVGPNQAGLVMGGEVVSNEPRLLDKESQLLFWIADKKATLVQVR
jgi:hypothetical protein